MSTVKPLTPENTPTPKNTPTPILLHLLLESTPNQQTKIICSMVVKSVVYMYVWASS